MPSQHPEEEEEESEHATYTDSSDAEEIKQPTHFSGFLSKKQKAQAAEEDEKAACKAEAVCKAESAQPIDNVDNNDDDDVQIMSVKNEEVQIIIKNEEEANDDSKQSNDKGKKKKHKHKHSHHNKRKHHNENDDSTQQQQPARIVVLEDGTRWRAEPDNSVESLKLRKVQRRAEREALREQMKKNHARPEYAIQVEDIFKKRKESVRLLRAKSLETNGSAHRFWKINPIPPSITRGYARSFAMGTKQFMMLRPDDYHNIFLQRYADDIESGMCGTLMEMAHVEYTGVRLCARLTFGSFRRLPTAIECDAHINIANRLALECFPQRAGKSLTVYVAVSQQRLKFTNGDRSRALPMLRMSLVMVWPSIVLRNIEQLCIFHQTLDMRLTLQNPAFPNTVDLNLVHRDRKRVQQRTLFSHKVTLCTKCTIPDVPLADYESSDEDLVHKRSTPVGVPCLHCSSNGRITVPGFLFAPYASHTVLADDVDGDDGPCNELIDDAETESDGGGGEDSKHGDNNDGNKTMEVAEERRARRVLAGRRPKQRELDLFGDDDNTSWFTEPDKTTFPHDASKFEQLRHMSIIPETFDASKVNDDDFVRPLDAPTANDRLAPNVGSALWSSTTIDVLFPRTESKMQQALAKKYHSRQLNAEDNQEFFALCTQVVRSVGSSEPDEDGRVQHPGEYAHVVISSITLSSGKGNIIFVNTQGKGSTYCYLNKGPHQGTMQSRVYFMIRPDPGYFNVQALCPHSACRKVFALHSHAQRYNAQQASKRVVGRTLAPPTEELSPDEAHAIQMMSANISLKSGWRKPLFEIFGCAFFGIEEPEVNLAPLPKAVTTTNDDEDLILDAQTNLCIPRRLLEASILDKMEYLNTIHASKPISKVFDIATGPQNLPFVKICEDQIVDDCPLLNMSDNALDAFKNEIEAERLCTIPRLQLH